MSASRSRFEGLSLLYLSAHEARYPIAAVYPAVDAFDPLLDYTEADRALLRFLEATEAYGAAVERNAEHLDRSQFHAAWYAPECDGWPALDYAP